MARDINSTILIGNLTRDGELKTIPGGKEVLNFAIAVRYDKTEDAVNYFDCAAWGKTAVALAPYLKKGKRVAVQGRLRQERWEKDGVKHSRVKVDADSIQLLTPKDRAEDVPEVTAPFVDGKDDIPF